MPLSSRQTCGGADELPAEPRRGERSARRRARGLAWMIFECAGADRERERAAELLEHVDLGLRGRIDEAVRRAAPPARRHGHRNLRDAIRAVQVLERVRAHEMTG